jgi:hypothetical protein
MIVSRSCHSWIDLYSDFTFSLIAHLRKQTIALSQYWRAHLRLYIISIIIATACISSLHNHSHHLRNTTPQAPPTTMANSSDSSHATSSGSDSDHPHTPESVVPQKHKTTSRLFAAPSKIPKLRVASVSQVAPSPPRTPADCVTEPVTLDWGSGGEWSALAGDIEASAGEVCSEAVDDDIPLAEVTKSAASPALETTMASSRLFDDYEHTASNLKRPNDMLQSKEVSDDDEPLMVFEDVDQRGDKEENGEEKVTGGVVLETESSDAAASHTSDSENSDMHTTSGPEQFSEFGSSEGHSDNDELPIVSILGESNRHVSKQDGPDDVVAQEIELSDADASDASDSDVSVMKLPTNKIRGPLLNTSERGRSTERRARISPEMVLRGLIRDAHPEMIHFTLPHSLFSPGDLRKGLQYAYSMLQAATSMLAILALLDDDTMDMSATDLRRWVTLVDNSSPKTRLEPRISVIFESLSVGEMKAALEELVQSRLVVEREVEETRESLIRGLGAKERLERSAIVPAESADDFDNEVECSTNKEGRVSGTSETAFDAFLTVVMVVLIGALYLCIRE